VARVVVTARVVLGVVGGVVVAAVVATVVAIVVATVVAIVVAIVGGTVVATVVGAAVVVGNGAGVARGLRMTAPGVVSATDVVGRCAAAVVVVSGGFKVVRELCVVAGATVVGATFAAEVGVAVVAGATAGAISTSMGFTLMMVHFFLPALTAQTTLVGNFAFVGLLAAEIEEIDIVPTVRNAAAIVTVAFAMRWLFFDSNMERPSGCCFAVVSAEAAGVMENTEIATALLLCLLRRRLCRPPPASPSWP
jgi:hypothetical protein